MAGNVRLLTVLAFSLLAFSLTVLTACSNGGADENTLAYVPNLHDARSTKSSPATVYVAGYSGVAVYTTAGQYLRTVKLPDGQIAADSMGNLFAHKHTNKVIGVYERRGRKFARKILTKADHYRDLWLDDASNVYADCGVKNVCEYAAQSGDLIRELRGPIRSPAFDAAGAMYAIISDDSIGVYAPGATSPERTITDGAINAIGLAVDPQGDLYVLSDYTGSGLSSHVNVYNPGASSPSRTVTSGLTIASMIATDGAGTLYVLNDCAGTAHCTNAQNSVAIYSLGSSTPEKVVTDGLDYPAQIAVDSASNLYVANSGAGTGTGNVTVYSAGDYSLLHTLSQGIVKPGSIAISP